MKTLFDFLKELLLFLWNLPSYLTKFFKGLRIFSESYDGILKRSEELQETYKKMDLNKTFGNNIKASTEFIVDNRNQLLELKKEQEQMFNQLFSIFIATVAMIISILALIIKK